MFSDPRVKCAFVVALIYAAVASKQVTSFTQAKVSPIVGVTLLTPTGPTAWGLILHGVVAGGLTYAYLQWME